VTQDWATPKDGEAKSPYERALTSSYYALLGVHPSASVRDIRQAYRDLSKLYHPDTTAMPPAIATTKFQKLNEAYATLSSPERRLAYDQKIGYSRVIVAQPLPSLHQTTERSPFTQSSSAYLDPTDRPLSPGEIFAVFILGLTFVGCLVLAIAIGITRGDALLKPITAQNLPSQAATTAISVIQEVVGSAHPPGLPPVTQPKQVIPIAPPAKPDTPPIKAMPAAQTAPMQSSDDPESFKPPHSDQASGI